MKDLIVVALGGNTLMRAKENFSIHQEVHHIEDTCMELKKIAASGYRLVITHGNGPQVGDILLAQKCAKGKAPQMPLDVLGAQTQGEIGYLLQRIYSNIVGKEAVTLVTQVLVDPKDSAFRKPSKFIGPFHSKPGYGLKKDINRGYRKVVASPEPLEIVEKDTIKGLVQKGYTLIACGGGGIPVIRKKGKLEGVEAVIDKDLAAERLGTLLGADTLLILTDVEKVALNYGKKNQEWISMMSVKEARKYMEEGQFAPGSMRPKIRAAVRFIANGGKRVIIATPEKAYLALKGKAGTEIVR